MWGSTPSTLQPASRSDGEAILGVNLETMMAHWSMKRHKRHIRRNQEIWAEEWEARLATHRDALREFNAMNKWDTSDAEKQDRMTTLRFAYAEKAFATEACSVMHMLGEERIGHARVHFERMLWWDSRANSLTQGRSDVHLADRFKARRIMRYVSTSTIGALEALEADTIASTGRGTRFH